MIHCVLCRVDKERSEFQPSRIHTPESGNCRTCMALYLQEFKKGTEHPALAVRMANPPVVCRVCGQSKPCEEINPRVLVPTCFACVEGTAAERKREASRVRRMEIPPGEKGEASRAYRAGMRKNKCAVCSTIMDGQGVCVSCMEIIEELGGLEGLKRAVRAVRYLSGKD